MFAVLLFVFQLGLYSVTPIALPDYIKQCSRSDPNLNECALKAARASVQKFADGDPERDLVPLNPLYIDEITVYVPKENGLKIVFSETYFYGFKELELKNLRFDLNKKLIIADALVDLDIVSKYDLSGKLVVVPIKANGDASIQLKKTLLKIRIWYEHAELEDGKIHWNITKHDIRYEIEKGIFKLDNLLNDKNISDQVNRLLNELWREIVADAGPTIVKSLGAAVVRNVAVLLKQVSFDEMMPE